MHSAHPMSSSGKDLSRQDLVHVMMLGGDVNNNVEALFKIKAEELIANGGFRKALIQSRKRNLEDTHELLESLIQQFIDENIQNAQWQQVVSAYVEYGRYYALLKNFNLAKSYLESALFYSKKPSAIIIPTLSLFNIIRELTHYCIEYLKTLNVFEMHKVTHWRELHLIKYSLQQLIAFLGEIYNLTNKVDDRRLYSKYELLLADTYALLGVTYNNKIQEELARTSPRSVNVERAFYRQILDLYRSVIIHSNLAKSILEKMDITEKVKKKIDVLNVNIRSAVEQRESIEVSHDFAKENDESPAYLKSRLFNLVSNRNVSADEVRTFIDEYKLDVNAPDDSNKVNNSNNDKSILEPSLLDHIVGAGRPEVLSLILNNYPVKVSLFATDKTYGIVHYISALTMPGIREIVYDPHLPQYQHHPDLPLLIFFLDTIAGRCSRVQEYLERYPEGILKIPESLIEGEPTNIPFVLHMAVYYKQLAVVRYLEKFIQNYINNNHSLANIENLKILYKSLANCYIFTGWTMQRRKMVDDLMSICLKILDDRITEIKSEKNELTELTLTEIIRCEAQKVECMLLQVFQYAAEAERESADAPAIEFNLKAEHLFIKIFEIINKYEKNNIAMHLAELGTNLQLLNETRAELAVKLLALEKNRTRQKVRLELYDQTSTDGSETEEEQLIPLKSKAEAPLEKVETKEKKFTTVFALPPGLDRSNRMFPPSPSSSPKTMSPPPAGHQKDTEFPRTWGAKGG